MLIQSGSAGIDQSDGALLKDGLLYSGNSKIFCIHTRCASRSDLIEPEICATLSAQHFGSYLNRNRIPFLESNSTAEKGDDITGWCKTKDIGTLQKKVPLFGKVERKPGEVYPALIDLGFCKVCVYCKRGSHAWGNVIGHIKSGVPCPLMICCIFIPGPIQIPDRIGRYFQSQPLIHLIQTGYFPCILRTKQPLVSPPSRPKNLFVYPTDSPLKIDAPFRVGSIKIKCPERNDHLCNPAPVVDSGSNVPNSIPFFIKVRTLPAGQQAVTP